MDRDTFVGKVKELKPIIREIDIPELGGSVYVRMMGLKERDIMEAQFDIETASKTGYATEWLLRSLCDKDGTLILTDADRPMLESLPASIGLKLAKAALEVNAFSLDAVDELAKNS